MRRFRGLAFLVVALALTGCGNIQPCWNCYGGPIDPPFAATLRPTYLQVERGGVGGPLVVEITPEYPTRFALVTCLRKRDDSFPPPGIYLVGTDPEDPWTCLIGGAEGPSWYEVYLAVRPEVPPGVYPLRLQVGNEAVMRRLDFTLEVR